MSKKWKKRLRMILFIFVCVGLGAVSGYFLAPYFGSIGFLDVIYTIIILILSFPLHVILHELGHVLGGLLSGYEFIMFRLFNTVWIKTPAGLSKRKEYIQGVLGQALMVPPKTKENEQPPSIFYHASGLLMNLLTAILFVFLGRMISIGPIAYFFYVSAIFAGLMILLNALPFQGTDGYNILQQFKHEETQDEITEALYMYRDMVHGVSFAELQKYVDLESIDSLQGATAATMYTVRASYLFEIKDFEGAHKIYAYLWRNLSDLFPGHHPDVTLNYLFSLLLVNPSHPDVQKITQSKIYQEYRKVKQADFILTYAAKALYVDEDVKKAQTLLDEGEEYIHLAPTVTEEKFMELMYQYVKEQL